MKHLTKISLIAASAAIFATAGAFADDQRLETQHNFCVTEHNRTDSSETVAIYANDRGLGQGQVQNSDQQAPELQMIDDAHGHTHNLYR